MATGNVRRKFDKIYTCGLRDMRVHRQTNEQTVKQTDIQKR